MRKMIVILFAGALLLLMSFSAWGQEQESVSKQAHKPVEFMFDDH